MGVGIVREPLISAIRFGYIYERADDRSRGGLTQPNPPDSRAGHPTADLLTYFFFVASYGTK